MVGRTGIYAPIYLAVVAFVTQAPSVAFAACLSDTTWANQTQVYEEIPIYLRAPESEEDLACDGDVRRLGYSIFDIEQQVLLLISRVNEMMGDKPILTYGGRVCLRAPELGADAASIFPPGHVMYPDFWDEQTNGKPFGIEITVPECNVELGAIADSKSEELFSCGVAHGWVRITAYHDDDGNLCPRPAPPANKIISVTDACVAVADEIEGSPCEDGDPPIECACHDGNDEQDYIAWHKCDVDELKYSECQCWGRGYERFSLGVGREAPFEPNRCDSLGDEHTKDILNVMMHEVGHVLGMRHSGLTGIECVNDHGFSVGVDQAAGIMDRNLHEVQRWLRGSIYSENEIQGMQAMYSEFGVFGWEGTDWNNEWTPVFYESSDDGATWSATQSFGAAITDAATRVAISSTAVDEMSPSREFQAYAWATRDGDVMHAVRDASGFHDLGVNADLGAGGASYATTFYPPSVAVGEDRLMVAWVYKDPAENGSHVAHLRWAHRGLEPSDVTDWSSGPSANLLDHIVYHCQVEVGYDATTGLFALISLTQGDEVQRGSQLRIAEFDLAINSNPADDYPLRDNDAPQAIDFSAPICFFDATAMTSRCTVLFNQILLSGMTLSSISWTPGGGGADVEHAPLDLTAIGSFELVSTVGGVDFFGMFGTNGEPDGFQFFTASRAMSSGLLDGPPSTTTLPTSWFADPIHPHRLPGLGSRMTLGGDLVLTAVGVDTTQADGTREPVECDPSTGSSSGASSNGDGDDGDGGDGDDSSDTDSAGGGESGGDGCDCRAPNEGDPAAALFLLVVSGGRRISRWRAPSPA